MFLAAVPMVEPKAPKKYIIETEKVWFWSTGRWFFDGRFNI